LSIAALHCPFWWSLTDCLSKETIQQLSYDALQELIDIERARLKKTQN
jgi:hypothetical protein